MELVPNAKAMAKVTGSMVGNYTVDSRKVDGTLSVESRQHFERIKSDSKCVLKGAFDYEDSNFAFEVELASAANIHTIMRLVAAPNDLTAVEIDSVSGYLKHKDTEERKGSYWVRWE